MHLLIFKSVDLTHSIVTISALFFLFLPRRIYFDLYIRKKTHNLYTRRIISRHLPGILYMNLLFRAFIFLHIAYNHTFFIVMFCLFFNGRAILSIFQNTLGKIEFNQSNLEMFNNTIYSLYY